MLLSIDVRTRSECFSPKDTIEMESKLFSVCAAWNSYYNRILFYVKSYDIFYTPTYISSHMTRQSYTHTFYHALEFTESRWARCQREVKGNYVCCAFSTPIWIHVRRATQRNETYVFVWLFQQRKTKKKWKIEERNEVRAQFKMLLCS